MRLISIQYEEDEIDEQSSDDDDIPTPRSSEQSRTQRRPVKEPAQAEKPIRATPIMVDVTTPSSYPSTARDYSSTPTPTHANGDVPVNFVRTPQPYHESNMEYHAPPLPVKSEPQYPPPPPRRPDKQKIEDPFYPVSPPDSGSRRGFAEEVSGNGVNGHRTTTSYPEVPVRAPSTNSVPQQQEYVDDYGRSTAGTGKKTPRWLKGMKN